MAKPKFPYAGDAALKRLLDRYQCPFPFHVVRMRFWGEIVSPSFKASPIKTIKGLWPDGLPIFEDGAEANPFFQALMGLWNNVSRFQDGSLKLQKIEKIDTREVLHAAAKLRVEELVDGFNCVVNIMLYDSGVNKWREPAVEGLTSAWPNRLNGATWLAPHRTFS